jgi:hypothetical protein
MKGWDRNEIKEFLFFSDKARFILSKNINNKTTGVWKITMQS